MKYFSFHQQGKRPYQEDNLLTAAEAGLWMVCDGVGGGARGDLASKLAIETIRKAVKEEGLLPNNEEALQQLTAKIEQAFGRALRENHELHGMATTLTLLYLHEKGATTAHIGDSRIYWLQPQHKRYWRTKDHSLVQELFDAGVLQNEEAMKTHPRRNVITRALHAKIEPAKQRPSVQNLQGLEAGDILLLCSDGLLEPFTEQGLTEILAEKGPDLETKVETIRQACEQESKDNNTGIFIQLETGDACLLNSTPMPEDFPWRPLSEGPAMLTDT